MKLNIKLRMNRALRKRIYLSTAIFSMVLNSFYPFLASYQYVYAEGEAVVEETTSVEEAASEEVASSEESSGTEESAPAEEPGDAPTEVQSEETITENSEGAAEIPSDTASATTDETQQGDILPDGVSDYRPEGSADSAPATEVVTDTTDVSDPVVEVIEPVSGESVSEEIEEECIAEDDVIVDSLESDWELNEETGYYETKENVKLGVKYIFPEDEKVTVTFSCLPKDDSYRSELKVQQVEIDDLNLPDEISTSVQYAFDITTDMKEGTFEYDITLPKSEGVEAEVSYIEGEIKDIVNKEITEEDVVEISVEDIDQEKDEGEIAVQDLDHFTIFVVIGSVGPIIDPSADPANAGYYLRHVGNPAPDVYSHAYQWATPAYVCDPNNSVVTFTGTIDASSMATGGVAFIGLVDRGLLELGAGGYQSGAYAYIYKINGATLRIGPTDGNINNGEIVQVFDDYTIPAGGVLSLVITIDNGEVTVQVGGDDPISDTYGDIKTRNNVSPYDWNEFEFGAIPGWDNWGSVDMPYDFDLSGCQEVTSSDRVKICHSTDSDSNPYIVHNPAKSGDLQGHNDHNGGVYPADDPWGDIIPPFTYWDCPSDEEDYSDDDTLECKKKLGSGGDQYWGYADKIEIQYPGKNWTVFGQAIYNNDCEIPTEGYCGDGNIDVNLNEQCDDGNLTDGDGCSATCTTETPSAVCGDGILNQDSEQCDDGNLTNGDGCSDVCTTETPPTRCGDGNVNSQAEECDDGNQNNDDYCSNTCEFNSVCLTDGTNMIVNGDFETPVVTSGYLWDIFNMYSPMLGWNVVWSGGSASYSGQTRPEPANLELHRGVNGWIPASGSQYAELDTDWDGPGNPLNNEPATVGISQEVPVLDGYKYKVEFSYSPRSGTDASNNVMDFDWDGATVDTYSGAGGGNTSWTAKSYDFVADETGITNIAFVEQGAADSLGMFLDDVNVTCLGPEVVPVCGDGVVDPATEECDGAVGVTNGTNFCTSSCKLIPIYDGGHTCPQGTVRSETPLISTSVSSTDSDGQTVLLGGGTYLFEADGDYGYGGDTPNNTINRADAGYATGDAWATRRDDLLGFPSTAKYRGITSLLSNMGTGTIGLVDWGEYNPDHIYSKVYNTSGNVQFLISDWYDTWYSGDAPSDTNKNQGGMWDNAESIALNIYTCDAISCGNGRQEPGEECDGTDGVTPGESFCTYDCKLAPIYDGTHACSEGKYPVAYSGPFTISSTDTDGIIVPVVGGKEYLFEASGTFIPTGAPGYLSDAGYTLVNGLVSNLYGIKGTPPDYAAHALLGNFGGGVGVIDWGDYNSDHLYRKAYSFGNNTDINFLIGDRYDNWFSTPYNNQSGMNDNTGDLSLTVYECATPVCGNGRLEFGEECDGTEGVKAGENFCTSTCQLIPLYDGSHTCAPGTAPVKVGDTYSIDSKDFDGISIPLTGGQQYLFKVFGTYNFGGGALNRVADAAYGSENSWASVRPDLGIWGTPLRGVLSVLGDLGAGVGVIEWDNDSIFDEDHAYEKAFTPTGDVSAQFLISDWYSDWYENTCKNQNCRGDNTGALSLEVYECRPSSDVTVCKYDSGEQPLSGWNVALKGDLMDTVNVLPNGSSYDSTDLPTGDYVLEASGYYTYRPGTAGAEYTDANYSKRHTSDAVYGGPYVPWVNVNTFPAPHTGWLGVMVNDSATNWSDYYASDHTYLLGFEDYTGPFSFKMLDDAYGDNSGSIPVKIYEGYAGTTGENGCVTFNNVPMGTYVVDEILKDGWVNLDNTRGAIVQVDGEGDRFVLVNDDVSEVGLFIQKTNFDWPDELNTGGIVTYQLTLRAVGGSLHNVFLVDLPPAGFIPGDFQASTEIDGMPTYASPGVWDIGDMNEDQTIILTYNAVIQPEVDPGIYPDLAWAYGENIVGQIITANSENSDFAINHGVVNDTFVGTQIEVVSENESPSAKTEVDEETEEEEVLGASITRLPATGASTVILVSVLGAMLIGTILIVLSRKKKSLLVLPVFLLAALLVPGSVYAITPDPDLVIRLEKPANLFNEPFEITFVAMDTKGGRDLTVTCYMDGPSSDAHSYDIVLPVDLKQGGDTDKCEVEGADLEGNGTYQFWVTLSAAEGLGPVESNKYTVDYDNEGPDKPKYIEVNKTSACDYEIEFKTANDGETEYVEVYMSDNKEFTANAASRIRTITIGPDEKYDFDESVAGDDCNHRQYFAVRAFDSAGNGSDVEAEEITDIEYKTIYKEETEEVIQEAYAGGSTTGVGGTGAGEGAEVVTSEEEIPGEEEGSILGEQTEGEEQKPQGFIGKVLGSPWTWILLILALGIITINGIRKNKEE